MRNRNTLCVYNDMQTSSILAAAIVKKFWIKENKDIPENAVEMIMCVGHKVASFYGTITFASWKEGEKLPDFRPYDKVILLGITLQERLMVDLYSRLKRDLVWIENKKSELYKIHNMSVGDNSLLNLINGLRGDMYTIAQLVWIMYSRTGLENAPEILTTRVKGITEYEEFYELIK